MQYDGFVVGPGIRDLRRKSNFTVEKLSENTGISTSTIKRIEQGNRPLSMKNLYSIMEAFKVDANTVLGITPNRGRYSIDERLSELDDRKREYFFKVFSQMLDQAAVSFT